MSQVYKINKQARKCLYLLMISGIVTVLYKISPQFNIQKYNLLSIVSFNESRMNHKRSIQNYTSNQDAGSKSLHNVPQVIYMLWDQGWTKAPPLQSLCLQSFRRHNAEFTIKAINLTEAENLIDRKTYYTDQAWKWASIQAKSDIIRVELMARYGGIWADSTVYCNEPVLNWVNDTLMVSKFFALERSDGGVTKETAPWIASWFLVAATDSEMIRTWRDSVRHAWVQDPLPQEMLGYFWVHRLFRNLVLTNSTFSTWFDEMPFISANPSHCVEPQIVIPPIYKLKAPSCKVVLERNLARGY